MKVRSFLIFFLFFYLGIGISLTALAQSTSTAPSYFRNLIAGDFGADVTSLQEFLITKGFLTVSGPTGYFGPLTSAAVAKWQASIGLPDTGYFGPLSRAAIEGNSPAARASTIGSNSASTPSIAAHSTPSTSPPASAVAYSTNLSIGATGSDVSSLQSFLIAKGFLSIPSPTGYFGAVTSAAVAKWQASIGLPDTGYFGSLSRLYLQALAETSPTTNTTPAPIFTVANTTSISSTTVSSTAKSPKATSTPAPAPVTAPIVYINDAGGGGGGGGGGASIPPPPPPPADTTPPSVSIASPVSSSTIAGPIAISITASDNVGVTKVELYVDGTLQTSTLTSPYTFLLSSGSLTNGTHTLTAKAYDAAGNIGTTASTTIAIVTPNPTTPTGLSFTKTTTSTLSLTWSSSTELGGTVAGYTIYQGNTQIATSTIPSLTTTGLTQNTLYSYSVSSYDAGGISSATSTSISTTTLSIPPALNYRFGLAVGDSLLGLSSAALNQELTSMASLGVGWVRFDMEWDNVQSSNSSSFNWSAIDPVVTAINAHNMKILAILDYTPTWAESSTCNPGSNFCAPSDPALFANFAKGAVQRYSSQGITSWEIWNEPNNAQFWGPTTNCNAYTALLKDAYTAIKQVEPSSTVITGGLSPAATDGTNMSPTDFLSCIYAAGGQGYFDAVGDHPYTFPSFPQNDGGGAWNQMAVTTPSLRSIMTANGDGTKQIWATEFGTPTNGPDPMWYVSEAQQSQMMNDAITDFASYPWAGPLFWYTYQDSGSSTSTNENFFGLIRADGSEKPAFTTLQNLLN